MNFETSRKILKIAGILSIIGGAIGLLVGILAVAGGGILAGYGEGDDQTSGAIVLIAGVVLLISGIVSLIEGICSTRAAKDTSKIMPAWIFAIIGLIFNGLSFIMNVVQSGFSSALSGIASIAFSVLIFLAANTIKKEEGL
ncbi:MAG: hypothetical protein IKX95_05010 [Lachnospiraceae bacterium]|nr:hypothetical protein [Lachnospiraceae bacterium]MBR5766123.1 hypothetical protein [Lachnospiraceae bacterium]